MKKLLFVLAFAFIGQQAFSQMYLVIVSDCSVQHPSGCNTTASSSNAVMTTVDPQGNVTYDFLPNPRPLYAGDQIAIINQKFNSIISQGYKLVNTSSTNESSNTIVGFLEGNTINPNTIWYFAIP